MGHNLYEMTDSSVAEHKKNELKRITIYVLLHYININRSLFVQ